MNDHNELIAELHSTLIKQRDELNLTFEKLVKTGSLLELGELFELDVIALKENALIKGSHEEVVMKISQLNINVLQLLSRTKNLIQWVENDMPLLEQTENTLQIAELLLVLINTIKNDTVVDK